MKQKMREKIKILFAKAKEKILGFLKKCFNFKTLPWILIGLVLLGAAGVGGYFLYQKKYPKKIQLQAVKNQNIYMAFLDEIYGIIQTNYWEKISDEQLTELYRLAVEKVSGKPATLPAKNREALDNLLLSNINSLENNGKKKEFAANVADVVLANLQPFGRSRLYTQKLQQDLSNAVNNIDPTANLYADLGVKKDSKPEEIKQAYEQKANELAKDTSEGGKQKLAQVNRAYEALKTPELKNRYDQTGAEPSVIGERLGTNIEHIWIKRFSPTTIQDLVSVADEADKNGGKDLNTLILDLRGNIGGAIDQLPYFLGPFVGPDREAYQYYHQGEKLPFRTLAGWLPSLVRYKKVVIMTDERSQSSAEVMAASLKKFNVGVLVGTKTKGWGTIERVFDIKTQIDPNEIYAAFLVHTITLRDDGQPIEGRGVDPAIDITAKDWGKQLEDYFNFPPLIQAVQKVWNEKY